MIRTFFMMVFLPYFAMAAADTTPPLTDNTAYNAEDFVKSALLEHDYFIESCQLALKHAQRDDVRDYAQRALETHRKLKQQLQQQTGNLVIGETREKENHRQFMEKLRQLPDDRFDFIFIDQQHDAYSDLVALYGEYRRNGEVETFKAFAENAYPPMMQLWDRTKHLHSQLRDLGDWLL